MSKVESYMRKRAGFAFLDNLAMIIFIIAVGLAELVLLFTLGAALIRGFDFGFSVFTLTAVFGAVIPMFFVAVLAGVWIVAVLKLCDVASAKGANTDGLRAIGLLASPVLLALIVLATPQKPMAPQQVIAVSQQ